MKHKHHIIPRYEGGSDDAENIVELSVTQHAMWHFAEWQRKKRWEDKLAWRGLAGFYGKEEIIHEIQRAPKSEAMKKRLSEAAKGRPRTKEWREALSNKFQGEGNPFYGLTHSEEVKAKLSKKKKGKVWWSNGTQTKMSKECPGPGWVRGRGKINHPSRQKDGR